MFASPTPPSRDTVCHAPGFSTRRTTDVLRTRWTTAAGVRRGGRSVNTSVSLDHGKVHTREPPPGADSKLKRNEERAPGGNPSITTLVVGLRKNPLRSVQSPTGKSSGLHGTRFRSNLHDSDLKSKYGAYLWSCCRSQPYSATHRQTTRATPKHSSRFPAASKGRGTE
jgi:hypothetical protein